MTGQAPSMGQGSVSPTLREMESAFHGQPESYELFSLVSRWNRASRVRSNEIIVQRLVNACLVRLTGTGSGL